MEDFKKQLIEFLTEEFNICPAFKGDIEEATDFNDLGCAIRDNSNDIADRIGHECEETECEWCDGECDDCKDKDKELNELLDYIETLENDGFIPDTINNGYKLKIFKTYCDDFTTEELQTMLSSKSTKIVI